MRYEGPLGFPPMLHPDFRPGPVKVAGYSEFAGEDATVWHIVLARATGREIAPPLVDPAFEPLSELEGVLLAEVPLDEQDLLRGPTPEDHADRLPPREEDPETRRK